MYDFVIIFSDNKGTIAVITQSAESWVTAKNIACENVVMDSGHNRWTYLGCYHYDREKPNTFFVPINTK